MKDDQSEEVVDARVRERAHHDRRGLGDERDLEVRTLGHVAQVIRLHQQRPVSRIREVRQVSHGEAEARRHDQHDYRHDHHDATEHHEPPRHPRPLDHGVALLRRLRPDPVRHDHAHDRREISRQGS